MTTAYTTTNGSTTDAVSASEIGKVGVEWNGGANPVQKSRAINNEKCRNGDVSTCNVKTLGDIIKDNKQYILIGTSLLPIVGDIQGFVEAETVADYVFATVGIVLGLGDAAQKAHKAKRAYETAKSTNNTSGMQNALTSMKAAIQEGVGVLEANGKASQITGRQTKQKAQNNEITQIVKANAGSPRRWDINLNTPELQPNAKFEVFNGIHKHIYITQMVEAGLIR